MRPARVVSVRGRRHTLMGVGQRDRGFEQSVIRYDELDERAFQQGSECLGVRGFDGGPAIRATGCNVDEGGVVLERGSEFGGIARVVGGGEPREDVSDV